MQKIKTSTKSALVLPPDLDQVDLQAVHKGATLWGIHPLAWVQAKSKGLNVRRHLEVFSISDYRGELANLNMQLKLFTKACDKMINCTSHPFPFYSNIYWFYMLIANFHALSLFLDRLKDDYQYIYLPYCKDKYEINALYSKIDINLANMSGIDLYFSPDIMVSDESLRFYKYHYDESKINAHKCFYDVFYLFRRNNIVKSLKSCMIKFIAETINFLNKRKQRKMALSIGPAHEFSEVARKLNIAKVAMDKKRRKLPHNDENILIGINNLYSKFLSKYSKYYQDYLCKCITAWFQNWIHSEKEMEDAERLIRKNIDIVFDGTGAVDSWDAWLSYCANKNNKPILCFQHGGGNGLFNNPFREYMDYNPLFQRTNVQYGKNSCWGHEQQIYEKVVTGSVSLKKLYNQSRQKIPHKQILYIPTHKQEENRFKAYNNNPGSDKIFLVDEAVISWAKNQNIRLIIKVHPVSKYEVKYFRLLASACGATNVDITQFKSVTKLMMESSLIIVNTVSMSIAQALSTDRAIFLIKLKEFVLPSESERYFRESLVLLETPEELKTLSYDEILKKNNSISRKKIRQKYLFNKNNPSLLIEKTIREKLELSYL